MMPELVETKWLLDLKKNCEERIGQCMTEHGDMVHAEMHAYITELLDFRDGVKLVKPVPENYILWNLEEFYNLKSKDETCRKFRSMFLELKRYRKKL